MMMMMVVVEDAIDLRQSQVDGSSCSGKNAPIPVRQGRLHIPRLDLSDSPTQCRIG